LHTGEPERLPRAAGALEGAVSLAPVGSAPVVPPLVIDRIG
jgi:hypothetical protein